MRAEKYREMVDGARPLPQEVRAAVPAPTSSPQRFPVVTDEMTANIRAILTAAAHNRRRTGRSHGSTSSSIAFTGSAQQARLLGIPSSHVGVRPAGRPLAPRGSSNIPAASTNRNSSPNISLGLASASSALWVESGNPTDRSSVLPQHARKSPHATINRDGVQSRRYLLLAGFNIYTRSKLTGISCLQDNGPRTSQPPS